MAAATAKSGEIRSDTLYTIDEVKKRLGLGIAALRSARRRGLRVQRIGRRGYILGRDLINYFNQLPC